MTRAHRRSGARRDSVGRRGGRRPIRLAATACAGLLLAACGSAADDVASPSANGSATGTANSVAADAAPIELSAELIASRRDEANGRIRIRLTNRGDNPVPLDAVELVAPPFSPEPARVNTRGLGPGRTVAYPVVHGDPECVGEAPTPGPVRVEIESNGRHVSVDPGESAGLIIRLLASACGRQQVAELVEIGLNSDWAWTEGGSEQTGSLTISRREDGPPVTLVDVRGGVNFTLELLEPRQSTLAADQQSMTVPVRTRAARCEGHAVADNSKPYTFTGWFSVDGGPKIHIEFTARDQHANFDRLCASR